MPWSPQPVTLTRDVETDTLHLQIGPEGFEKEYSSFKELERGSGKTIDMLWADVAASAHYATIDVNDFDALKSFVEGRNWKW